MDSNILKATQQWAKANGIDSVETEKVLDNMDMSDFLVFAGALEEKDYNTVGQLYNRASANIMESYKYFNGDISLLLSEQSDMKKLLDMSYQNLYEAYSQLPCATTYTDMISMATMKTLVYEGMGTIKPQAAMATQKPTNPASQFNSSPTNPTAMVDPAAIQQKAEKLSNPMGGNMQVTIPGDPSSGNQERIVDVDSVDIDPYNPESAEVVVKDPNMGNETNIVPITDVSMMDDGSEQEGIDNDGFDMNRMSDLAGIQR